jgi:hypothetical protein
MGENKLSKLLLMDISVMLKGISDDEIQEN